MNYDYLCFSITIIYWLLNIVASRVDDKYNNSIESY